MAAIRELAELIERFDRAPTGPTRPRIPRLFLHRGAQVDRADAWRLRAGGLHHRAGRQASRLPASTVCATTPANTSSSPSTCRRRPGHRGQPGAPYLCLRLDLDPAAIGALMLESDMQPRRREQPGPALAVSDCSTDLLDAVVRLLRLLRDAARHPDPGAARRARDPLSPAARRADVAHRPDRLRRKQAAAGQPRHRLDQAQLPRAVQHRGGRGRGAHEPVGAAPPLQGGDRHEPAAISEAAAAAGGAAADRRPPPPMRRRPAIASATTAPRSSAASTAACSAPRPCATPSACAAWAARSPPREGGGEIAA